MENLRRDDPRVAAWIETIIFAVTEAGINLLDTAPWYGHGTSEMVIGWAMEGLLEEKMSATLKRTVSKGAKEIDELLTELKAKYGETKPDQKTDLENLNEQASHSANLPQE